MYAPGFARPYLIIRVQAHIFGSRPLTNSLLIQVVNSWIAYWTPDWHHIHLLWHSYVVNAPNREQ